MKKIDDYFKSAFVEFGTAEEVECAARVEAALKKDGIKLTERFELLLKILQSPVLNFIMHGKIAELMISNVDEFLKSQNSQPGANDDG